MTDSSQTAPTPASGLYAERTGTREYIGRNADGAEVAIGIGPGMFSPGELLKLALATCQGLSADHRIARELGADFDAVVRCETVKNEEEERYESFQVEIVCDFSSLDEDARADLEAKARRSINRYCTVGHTLTTSADTALTFLDANEEK